MNGSFHHIPVLFNETIGSLNIKPDGIYVDCTSGGGGFSNRAQIEKLLPGITAHRELGKNAAEAEIKAWFDELPL